MTADCLVPTGLQEGRLSFCSENPTWSLAPLTLKLAIDLLHFPVTGSQLENPIMVEEQAWEDEVPSLTFPWKVVCVCACLSMCTCACCDYVFKHMCMYAPGAQLFLPPFPLL